MVVLFNSCHLISRRLWRLDKLVGVARNQLIIDTLANSQMKSDTKRQILVGIKIFKHHVLKFYTWSPKIMIHFSLASSKVKKFREISLNAGIFIEKFHASLLHIFDLNYLKTSTLIRMIFPKFKPNFHKKFWSNGTVFAQLPICIIYAYMQLIYLTDEIGGECSFGIFIALLLFIPQPTL